MKLEISNRLNSALEKLGYRNRVLRGRTLHARRGRDHLIIKLSRHGKVESVKAHMDITRSGVIGPRQHKAVYGKVSEELEAEFRMAYEDSKSSPR